MRSEQLDAASADRAFSATLTLPDGPGPFAAIVGCHPADDASRDHFLFRHLAAVLPPIGVAVARFDRRGNDVPFDAQARDVEAILATVRGRADIDRDRIGLWGFSQGAWIAPIVAGGGGIAFLVLVAATGVSPAAQMRYGIAKQARAAGHSDAEVAELLALRVAVEDFARGTRPRAAVQTLVDRAKGRSWFERAWVRPELPAAPGFWADMDFEPAAVFARVHGPVLLFYGEDDEWQPIDESIAVWTRAEGARITVVRLPGTGHTPVVGKRKDLASVSPAYTDTLVGWLRRVTAR